MWNINILNGEVGECWILIDFDYGNTTLWAAANFQVLAVMSHLESNFHKI